MQPNVIVDRKEHAPEWMLLPVNKKGLPAGVLIDHGNGRRIPFARRVNFATGEYEHLVPSPDGHDVMIDPITRKTLVRRGKALGRLELAEMGKAKLLGPGASPPKPVPCSIEVVTEDQIKQGREQYGELFRWARRFWGESKRAANDSWEEFMRSSDLMTGYLLPGHDVKHQQP